MRIRSGLLERLRETRSIPSVEHQARLAGLSRTTLERIDNGAAPSAAAMAQICLAFNLGPGEAFEIVDAAADIATDADSRANVVSIRSVA